VVYTINDAAYFQSTFFRIFCFFCFFLKREHIYLGYYITYYLILNCVPKQLTLSFSSSIFRTFLNQVLPPKIITIFIRACEILSKKASVYVLHKITMIVIHMDVRTKLKNRSYFGSQLKRFFILRT
jgi:hypothetical protein